MIESVTVGGVQYNIAQASAVDQKRLLHMLAARLTYNVGADTETSLDVNFIFGGLMSLPEADFDAVARIVLYKTVEHGGDRVVDIEDFQGRINDYYLLVAEAVLVNLGSFIDWLSTAREPTEEAESAS